MAFDAFMMFVDQDGKKLEAESLTDFKAGSGDTLLEGFEGGKVFEIDDFSFDIEQTLNIGSQSSGVGAGKVTFNPFSFSRKTDVASARFFETCCQGTHFKYASLALRKAAGAESSGLTFLRFDFRLVGVKTISWSGADGDEAMKEEVTFEYGAMNVQYRMQKPDGKLDTAKKGGWNRVRNKREQEAKPDAAV
jgi:type VI secretion system secreted protein Hcp